MKKTMYRNYRKSYFSALLFLLGILTPLLTSADVAVFRVVEVEVETTKGKRLNGFTYCVNYDSRDLWIHGTMSDFNGKSHQIILLNSNTELQRLNTHLLYVDPSDSIFSSMVLNQLQIYSSNNAFTLYSEVVNVWGHELSPVAEFKGTQHHVLFSEIEVMRVKSISKAACKSTLEVETDLTTDDQWIRNAWVKRGFLRGDFGFYYVAFGTFDAEVKAKIEELKELLIDPDTPEDYLIQFVPEDKITAFKKLLRELKDKKVVIFNDYAC